MTSPPGDSDQAGSHGDQDGSYDGQGGAAAEPRTLVCARCGARAEAPPPITWTCSVQRSVRSYFCETCARENLRAIEGRLDPEWW
ncbi:MULTISPECIES: hypothetical protein [unclassified Streptomyces]|uniref:hypothetical protein n=1 Tax=unclassified Streptomyces TaxID=2593676 RepID=UPI0033A7124F